MIVSNLSINGVKGLPVQVLYSRTSNHNFLAQQENLSTTSHTFL